MISVILITSLVIIILIILLSFVSRMTKNPERLKTNSIVIVDTRGQQSVNEVEFAKFMDKMGALLVNNRHFDQNTDLLNPDNLTKKNNRSSRSKFQNKYLDPAAEELKAWIKSTDNNPFITEANFTNPIEDELNSLAGENNPILIHKRQKSGDNDHKSEDRLSSLEDLATYVRQIKEINLQFPDNERKAVNLTRTHKLIVELLRQYYSSFDPTMFERNITEVVDLPNRSGKPIGNAKMKVHKSESEPLLDSSLSQRNSIVDSAAFADDDKTGTSTMRTHDGPMDTDKTNLAIEGLVSHRSAGRINFTGGRKFIMNG